MAKQLRARAVRRKQIDDEKLALAFLLLAKVLREDADHSKAPKAVDGDAEAA